MFGELSGPGGSIDLEIPATAMGPLNLVALGFDAAGDLVALSQPVAIEVTPDAALSANGLISPHPRSRSQELYAPNRQRA